MGRQTMWREGACYLCIALASKGEGICFPSPALPPHSGPCGRRCYYTAMVWGAPIDLSPKPGLSMQDLAAFKVHILDILDGYPDGLRARALLRQLVKRTGDGPLDLLLPKREGSRYDEEELKVGQPGWIPG